MTDANGHEMVLALIREVRHRAVVACTSGVEMVALFRIGCRALALGKPTGNRPILGNEQSRTSSRRSTLTQAAPQDFLLPAAFLAKALFGRVRHTKADEQRRRSSLSSPSQPFLSQNATQEQRQRFVTLARDMHECKWRWALHPSSRGVVLHLQRSCDMQGWTLG